LIGWNAAGGLVEAGGNGQNKVAASVTGGGYGTGGFIGVNYGALDGATLALSGSNLIVTGQTYVGGAVGDNFGALSGNFGLPSVAVTGTFYVGGVVGANEAGGTMSGGEFGGQATALEGAGGGIAGLNLGTMSHVVGVGSVQYYPSSPPVGTFTWAIGAAVGINAGTMDTVEQAPADPINSVTQYNVPIIAAGGLVGVNMGSIRNSWAEGSLNIWGGAYDVGGLVGENLASGSIVDSYTYSGPPVDTHVAAGQILQGVFNGPISNAGGLVGANYGSINRSWVGEWDANFLWAGGFPYAFVFGNANVGGLVGYNAAGGTVANSFVADTVWVGNGFNLGGLIGENAGSVSTSYAAPHGIIGGLGNEGGLVGQNDPGASYVSVYWDDSQSYLKGAVTRGIIGGGAPASGVTEIGPGVGASPFDPASYPGFDFSNIWNPPQANGIFGQGRRPTLR
jgi:hypothetical protein